MRVTGACLRARYMLFSLHNASLGAINDTGNLHATFSFCNNVIAQRRAAFRYFVVLRFT